MLLELILTGLIQTNIQTTNIGGQNGDTTRQHNIESTVISSLLDSGVSDTRTIRFQPGDSYVQVRAREVERERAERSESYTGQGKDIKIVGYSNEQCVQYFKRQKGISQSLGYAGNIKPNSQTPQIGSGVLENGHISLVIGISENEVRVREANYYRGKITERTIPKSQIRGYLVI